MKWVSHWQIKKEMMNKFNCVLIKDKHSGKKIHNHYHKSLYYCLNIETGEMSEAPFPLDLLARCLFGFDAEVIEKRKFYYKDKKTDES